MQDEVRDFFNVCGAVVNVDLKSKPDPVKIFFA